MGWFSSIIYFILRNKSRWHFPAVATPEILHIVGQSDCEMRSKKSFRFFKRSHSEVTLTVGEMISIENSDSRQTLYSELFSFRMPSA